MPASRRETLRTVSAALADGRVALDPGADRDEMTAALLALRGVGPWTAGYVRMRALGDPDVFLAGDAGVRHGLALVGARAGRGGDVGAGAEEWRPWRSYALHHLWRAAANARAANARAGNPVRGTAPKVTAGAAPRAVA